MFKKKNNLLLAGAVLIALGGMNTASAAINCTVTPALAPALAAAAALAGDPTAALPATVLATTASATATAAVVSNMNLSITAGIADIPAVMACSNTILTTIPEPARSLLLSALGTIVAGDNFLAASAANLAVSLTGAFPAVSRNNLGQALIFPYYTTRDGKKSIINIFNTSNRTVAAKVRFHESHNSRDVLDFTVVLSPYDKWSGAISEGTNGPIFTTNDSTCTVPAIPAAGQPLNAYAYNDATVGDKGDKTVDRLREGYVEVIAMGDATEATGLTAAALNSGLPFPATAKVTTIPAGSLANVAYYAKHVKTGTVTKPRDCATVIAAFGATVAAPAPGPYATIPNASGMPAARAQFAKLGINNNPLRGALSIISTKNGVGFGTAAVAIENFTNPNNLNNLIAAQNPPFFHEPSLASRNGLWTISGLRTIEATLAAKTIINEWSNNTRNGANTDWVIQFPTKAFHVDIPSKAGIPDSITGVTVSCDNTNYQAARNIYRGNLPCTPLTFQIGATNGVAPFEKRFDATGSMVTIGTMLIDKEENSDTAAGGVVFSPARSSATPSIPYESNIVTFSGAGGVSVLSSNSPELALDPVGSTLLTETNGMARITFPNASIGGINTGLPVVGFVAKQRNQGNSALSFGQIMNHSMTRD